MMRFVYKIGKSPLLAACLWLALALLLPAAPAPAEDWAPEIMDRLSSFEERTTGSKGERKAADLIEQAFKKIPLKGVRVGRQWLHVPVVQSKAAFVTFAKTGAKHALKPYLGNAINPGAIAEPGLKGRLLYAGKGELAAFDGKDVNGSIVLMDMDSGKRWINAASLGAGALIYIDDPQKTVYPRGRFKDKYELTPVNFPRFYLTRKQARKIFGAYERFDGRTSAEVRLTARTFWERKLVSNVYCLIPGTDKEKEDEMALFTAHFDSKTYIPKSSPAADDAASIEALLAIARHLGENPPARNVLLAATTGHAQNLAGTRELVWALKGKRRKLRKERSRIKKWVKQAEVAHKALNAEKPFRLKDKAKADLVYQALMDQVKTHSDELANHLIKLRLEDDTPENAALIKKLAEERRLLRRIGWLEDFSSLADDERAALSALLPPARHWAALVLKDAKEQYRAIKSTYALKSVAGGFRVAAGVSLHLSGHGRGVGGFSDGWYLNLRPRINRTRLYSQVGDVMRATVRGMKDPNLRSLYHDTIRPSPKNPWRNYLPDRPAMSGEVTALAGWPAFALATVQDMRPYLGTPYDTPDHLDHGYLKRQQEMVLALTGAICKAPLPDPGFTGRVGFGSVRGRANLLRMGELFPDQPATGTLLQIYQGKSYGHVMVDTQGLFRYLGVTDKKHVWDKAIIEGYRIDDETGKAVWAIDKRQTGKEAYRVKMWRRDMETDLVFFSCNQTTLFTTLEPRTFHYMTRIEVIDGRTEARPMRYWWSRMDTWSSTLLNIFLEPAAWMKMSLSDTVLGWKLLLLNNSPEDPIGKGYPMMDTPEINATEFKVARDMWTLVGSRIANLESHGIINQRIAELRKQGSDGLEKASEHFEEKDYAGFLDKARAAWALAGRVYNDIDKTQKDVLFGVLFYVALFVPFAYCLERLLFGFTDIHKRIVAFLVTLVVVIGVIYLVHPAFELTYSPMVVILAFFILSLSAVVGLIIFMRFEQEMVNLQRRSQNLKQTGISRGKAFMAAFVIGVSNLRRRPIRTALTCVTLIILTFTIMNFTAVKSARQHGKVNYSDSASYEGLLVRTLNWSDLPVESLGLINGAFEGKAVLAPRVWFENKDRTQSVIVPVVSRLGKHQVRGLVGLSADEPQVTGLDKILKRGRWLAPGAGFEVILPEDMALKLGVTPNTGQNADQVFIWGIPFTVVGTIKKGGLTERPDLDGEIITPVVYPSEAGTELTEAEAEAIESGEDVAVYQNRYQHVPGPETIIVPAKTLVSLGGKVKGAAIQPKNGGSLDELAARLSDRFGLMIFSGGPGGTSLYYASDTLSYSGVPNIIIPLIIAVLIVLNTMIGSVYERKREIAVYTSVGLAPSHVSFLFIAESLAFAVLSVVAGYLLAQTSAHFLADTPLWEGMTANYSSLAGVAAMILVIAVVLISAIYPSKVAAEIAIPDVNRSWKMPEARGSEVVVDLPFLIKPHEQDCCGGYLLDYYQAHYDVSHGLFSTDDLKCEFACRVNPLDKEANGGQGPSCFNLDFRVWMAPFDFGVRQQVWLEFCPSDSYKDFFEIKVRLAREAGEEAVWRRLSKSFINDLRKQLLIWRSLEDEARFSYEASLKERMAGV